MYVCILVIFVAAGHMLWMKDFYAHLNAIKAEVDYQDDYITCRKHDRCSVRKRTKPKEANVQSEITDIDPAQKSCAKDKCVPDTSLTEKTPRDQSSDSGASDSGKFAVIESTIPQ